MATLRILSLAIVLLCLTSICYEVEARGRGGSRVGRVGRGGSRVGRIGRGVRGGRIARPGVPGIRRGQRAAPASIFSVLRYGAKPDGKFDNAQAFIKAWNAACHWRGNARLVIPLGKFLAGPIVFQGPCNGQTITVQVKGDVLALPDISEYTDPQWISFENINGLILTGGGTFDGQGAQAWQYNDCSQNPNCVTLPSSIKFTRVNNANIRRINSINSMGFHLTINNCNTFGAQNIHITAPKDSPNTDGIHISESSAIRITRSVIGTGDDCISIGQGSNNISISRVTCGPGHGISVGSLGKRQDEMDVNGVYVRNCTFLSTDNGVRVKTWGGSPPSTAAHIYFQDLIMNTVKRPIVIDQNYCGGSSSCNRGASRVKLSDIHFTNIKGTATSPTAVSINCSPQFPCENVQMFDINLPSVARTAAKAGPASVCTNVKVGYGGIQVPTPCP